MLFKRVLPDGLTRELFDWPVLPPIFWRMAAWVLGRGLLGALWGALMGIPLGWLFWGWFCVASEPGESPYPVAITGCAVAGLAGAIIVSCGELAILHARSTLWSFARAVALATGGAVVSGLAVSAWRVLRAGTLAGQPPGTTADQVWWIVMHTFVPNMFSGALLGLVLHLYMVVRARPGEEGRKAQTDCDS
jgi:hypothetical protein